MGDRHAGDLLRRLDGPGLLQGLLGVVQLEALVEQRLEAAGAEAIHRQAPVAAAVGRDQLRHLAGPAPGRLIRPVAGGLVVPDHRRPALVQHL